MVERIGDNFLAGAALALNEHVDLGGGDLADQFFDRPYGGLSPMSASTPRCC